MSEFKCEKCNKILSGKQALQRHKERKFPCKQVIVPNTDNYNCENTEISSMRKLCKIVCEISAKLENTKLNTKSNINCDYCNKSFTHINSLYKHKSHLRCKKMSKIEIKRRALKLKNKGLEKVNEITKNKIKSLKI